MKVIHDEHAEQPPALARHREAGQPSPAGRTGPVNRAGRTCDDSAGPDSRAVPAKNSANSPCTGSGSTVAEVRPRSRPGAMAEGLEAAAERIVTWAGTLGARAGTRRVLAVEGRSGAGKTTLAVAVADLMAAPLIHMDDLYAGWDGLGRGVVELHDRVLVPLAEGRPAVWRRWDWAAGEYREDHPVPDAAWLVVEGVGAGGRLLRPYTSGLVWVNSPTVTRKRRALDRDGATYAPHWDRWARHEDAFYAAEQVREHAGLIIENPGD